MTLEQTPVLRQRKVTKLPDNHVSKVSRMNKEALEWIRKMRYA